MKELEVNIKRNGYDYSLTMASNRGYIYNQYLDGVLVGYEVFRRIENDRFDCVSFPRDESFGKWAWTYNNLEQATKRFETL
jgi:hypothetical protein